MHVQPLTNPQELQKLIAKAPLQPYLQSWAWGEFQHSYGRPIWRIGAFEGSELRGAALVIGHELMMNKRYLYCPHGPVADSYETWTQLLAGLREIGKKTGAMYVKVDPGIPAFSLDQTMYPNGWSLGTSLQPEHDWVVDLTQAEAVVLEQMHQKTRYNIRVAEKHGVTCRWSTDEKDVDVFLRLHHATYDRQHIRTHPDAYYRALVKSLLSEHMLEIVIAEVAGEPLAAALVVWHHQTATYVHGGSGSTHREAMAPYAMHWAVMKRAKERGVVRYDLGGVSIDDDPAHAWAGITRFKKGFGGEIVSFPPAMNYILDQPWYLAYRLAKRFRRITR